MAAADLEIGDLRVEFIVDYLLDSLNINPGKFGKAYQADEMKKLFVDFVDKADIPCFVVMLGSGGVVLPSYSWPDAPRNKGCYFIKRIKEGIAKDASNIRRVLLYGDFSPQQVDHFASLVQEVHVLYVHQLF